MLLLCGLAVAGATGWAWIGVFARWWPLGPLEIALPLVGASLLCLVTLAWRKKNDSAEELVPPHFESALDGLNEATLILSYEGEIVFANQVFLDFSGLPREEVAGKRVRALNWNWSDLNDQGGWEPEFRWLEAVREGKCRTGRFRGLPGSPESTLKMNAVPITDDGGRTRGAMISFQDVTQIQKKQLEISRIMESVRSSSSRIRTLNDQLEALVIHDSLTGCYLRQYGIEQLQAHWEEASLHGTPLSCLLVDVDHLRVINDDAGYQSGDHLLQDLGRSLRQMFEKNGIVSRYDGEKFLIVLPGIEVERAISLADSLRERLAGLRTGEVKFTVSAGISGMEDLPTSPRTMLSKCEENLNRAKLRGRNQVSRATPDDFTSEETFLGEYHSREVSSIIPYPAVTALFSALSFRDMATATHSRRVADLCLSIGQRLMSQSQCYVLEMSALLHDIGKIGVPDALLHKPTSLTDEEWAVMRDHDRIGVEIVRTAFATPALTEIVECYKCPYEESQRSRQPLPLGARILAVVDAYDSMTNDQIYRSAMSPAEAIAELRRCAGTQFDPEIVSHFVEVLFLPNREPGVRLQIDHRAAREIGMELEQLSQAVDNQNIDLLQSIAGRLCEIASRSGAPEIAAKAMELEQATACPEDQIGVLQCASELLTYCRGAVLRTHEAREWPRAMVADVLS